MFTSCSSWGKGGAKACGGWIVVWGRIDPTETPMMRPPLSSSMWPEVEDWQSEPTLGWSRGEESVESNGAVPPISFLVGEQMPRGQLCARRGRGSSFTR
eukprot:7288408-Pyramimonas_sp.AAC.1